MDLLQFIYCWKCSMDNAISTAIQAALTHLEDINIRMLFTDNSPAFNMVIPYKLSEKLLTLRLTPTLCD